MTIQVDTREHKQEWERIEGQFKELGVSYFRSKMYVGDYMSLDYPRLCIDRKKDLNELCGNVCQQHERFKKELIRAQENNIKLVILCEHGEGINTLEDVYFWQNPRYTEAFKKLRRKYPNLYKLSDKDFLENVKKMTGRSYLLPVNGEQLYKSLNTIRTRYGVDFYFCEPEDTGEMIVDLLERLNK